MRELKSQHFERSVLMQAVTHISLSVLMRSVGGLVFPVRFGSSGASESPLHAEAEAAPVRLERE